MPFAWESAPIISSQTKEPAWMSAPIIDSARPQSLSEQIPGPGEQKYSPNLASRKKDTSSTLMQKVSGLIEAGMGLGTAIPAGVAGQLAGAYEGITGGKYGTREGITSGEKRAQEISQKLTYEPRSESGKKYLRAVGEAFDESKLAGLASVPVGEMAALSSGARLARPGISAAGKAVAENIPSKKSTMSGIGAANTSEELLRAQRAADLPIPIKLTKGQKSRSFEQQKFERETAKLPEGERLRERFAEQNEQVPKVFDAFIDATGAQETNLRAIGKVIDKTLMGKVSAAKNKINKAYEEARSSGEMAQPVEISPLAKYTESKFSSEKNAPIIGVIDKELSRLSQKGHINIGDLEEIRKTINSNIQPGTPNATFGTEMKSIIDGMLQDKGGPKYKQARRLYENYAKEFKDSAVISKLLKNKPGTSDRAVALEDVFSHSIVRGSLDDVRNVRRTLQTAGPEGTQAWKELQGQTVRNIKDAITSGSARDVRGNPVVSPAKLNAMIGELDRDGKLDFIFGKSGAQKLRDVNDLAKDLYTSPPGSVNYSNTTSTLLHGLDMAMSAITGLPAPLASIANAARRGLKSRSISKKVTEALDEGPIPPKS